MGKVRLGAGIASLALLGVLPGGTVSSASAKSCGAGYTHAYVSGAEKCLHGGEYCAHAAAATYRRYGYVCAANGRLRQS